MTEPEPPRTPGRPATGTNPTRSVRVGASWDAAKARAEQTGETMVQVVDRLLTDYALDRPTGTPMLCDPFARRARLLPPYQLPHDADTFTVEYDAGCTARVEPTLRLDGVYMPELKDPGGPDMRQYVANWFATSDHTLTWPFWITMTMTKVREPGQRVTFARYLATVWRFNGRTTVGPSINDILNTELARHPEWGHGSGA